MSNFDEFRTEFFFSSEPVATSRVSQIPPVLLSDVQDVRGEVTGVVLSGAKAAKAVAFAFNKVHDIVEACASSSGWLACHNVWHPALAHFCGLAQLYGECLEKQTWSLGRCLSSPETSMSTSRLSPPLLPLGFEKRMAMWKKYVKTRMGKFRCRFHLVLAVQLDTAKLSV